EVVLVAEPGTELEARVRLARIGFDRCTGHLADPLAAFLDRPGLVTRSSRLTAAELADRMAEVPGLALVDVRNPSETAGGAIAGARLVPLSRLLVELPTLDPSA